MNDPVINPNGRGVSTQSTSTLKDLVFNPETGDFEQVERGTANEGDTVTKMTEDGFAIDTEEEDEIISKKNILFNPQTNEFEVVENESDTITDEMFIH